MLSISTLIPKECILIHPKTNDKSTLLKMMIDSLKSANKIENSDILYKAIMDREELSTTALDCECAIPHAHSSAVKETSIAVAILEEGLDFNSQDGSLSKLIFLISGPKNMAGIHLKLLSKMARILHDNELKTELMNAENEVKFIELIKNKEK